MKKCIWITLLMLAGPAYGAPVDALKKLGLPESQARMLLQSWNERHPGLGSDELIATLRQAGESGAPVDLLADKAEEGLAKGVPPQRLIQVLHTWGQDLTRAARTVREMRRTLASGRVSDREAILRLSLIQRIQKDETWLDNLKGLAEKNKIDLQEFLDIVEAVGHLRSRVGLKKKEAEQLGMVWMQQGIPAGDIGKHIRAIEIGRSAMPLAQVAQFVVENIMGGISPDEILRDVRDKQAGIDKHDLRGNPSAGKEPDDQKGDPESENDNKGKSNSGKGSGSHN